MRSRFRVANPSLDMFRLAAHYTVGVKRRSLLQAGALATWVSGSRQDAARGAPSRAWQPRVAEDIGSLDDATLRWMAQLGLEWVVLQGTDAVDPHGKGFWTKQDIADVQDRCDAFGMRLHSLLLPPGWLMDARQGRPGRDREIENICTSLEAVGAAGVSVVEWRWSPAVRWGSDVSRPEATELLLYFANGVMDAAERAGVRMSLYLTHPLSGTLGAPPIFGSTRAMEALLDAIPSPAHGFTFCEETVTETGAGYLNAVQRIGRRGRIHHVHFGSARGRVPLHGETLLDDWVLDMLAVMRAYRDVGYELAMVSGHASEIPDDLAGGKIERSFSHGYMRGLVQAVNA